MKISKILAGMSAAALAASMMAMAVSADKTATKKALYTATVGKDDLEAGKNGAGPKNNSYAMNPAEKLSKDVLATVDKVEATITNDNYVNGTIGGNTVAAGKWAAAAQQESSVAGTSTWTWSNVGGLSIDEDGKASLQVQFWWMNANGDDKTGYTTATTTVDKVVLYDKSGKVLLTYGDEGTTTSSTADSSSKADEATSSAADASSATEPVTPPKQNTATDTVKDLEIGANDTGFVAKDNTFRLVGDAAKGEYGYFASMDDLKKANVTAVTFILNIDDKEVEAGTWIGGGLGTNAESTGWKGHEFTTQTFVLDDNGNYVDKDGDGLADRVKECALTKIADGKYAYTLTNGGKTIFADTDTYAQLWMQDWSIKTMTLDKIILNPTTVYANPEQPKVGDAATSSTESGDSTVVLTDSVNSKTNSAATSSKAANNASNTNPSTGAAALAAVGVALAGAAVVATKKRK